MLAYRKHFCDQPKPQVIISLSEIAFQLTPPISYRQASNINPLGPFSKSYLFLQHTALGTGGVMYRSGNIVSGPLESLIELLMPGNADELDQVKHGTNLLLSITEESTPP